MAPKATAVTKVISLHDLATGEQEYTHYWLLRRTPVPILGLLS
jgi:hypothetical protein